MKFSLLGIIFLTSFWMIETLYPNQDEVREDMIYMSSKVSKEYGDLSMLNELYFERQAYTEYLTEKLSNNSEILGLNLISSFNINFTYVNFSQSIILTQILYSAFDFDVGISEITMLDLTISRSDLNSSFININRNNMSLNCIQGVFNLVFINNTFLNGTFFCTNIDAVEPKDLVTNSSIKFNNSLTELLSDENVFGYSRIDVYDTTLLENDKILANEQLEKAGIVSEYICGMSYINFLNMRTEQVITSFNPEDIVNPSVANQVILNQKIFSIEKFLDSQPFYTSFYGNIDSFTFELPSNSYDISPDLYTGITSGLLNKNELLWKEIWAKRKCFEYTNCTNSNCKLDNFDGWKYNCINKDVDGRCNSIVASDDFSVKTNLPVFNTREKGIIFASKEISPGIILELGIGVREIVNVDTTFLNHNVHYFEGLSHYTYHSVPDTYACVIQRNILGSLGFEYYPELSEYIYFNISSLPTQINPQAEISIIIEGNYLSSKFLLSGKYGEPELIEYISGEDKLYSVRYKIISGGRSNQTIIPTISLKKESVCSIPYWKFDNTKTFSVIDETGNWGELLNGGSNKNCYPYQTDSSLKGNYVTLNIEKSRINQGTNTYKINEFKTNGQVLFYFIKNEVPAVYQNADLNSAIDDLNQLAVRLTNVEEQVKSIQDYIESQESSILGMATDILFSLTAVGEVLSNSLKYTKRLTRLPTASVSRTDITITDSLADEFIKSINKYDEKISPNYNPAEIIVNSSPYSVVSKHYKKSFRNSELANKKFSQLNPDDFINNGLDMRELAHINPSVHLQFQNTMYSRFENQVKDILGTDSLPFGAVSVHKSPIEQLGPVGKYFAKKYDGTKGGESFLNNGHYTFPFHTSVSSNSFEYDVNGNILFTTRFHGVGEPSIIGPTNAKNPRVKLGYVKVQYDVNPTTGKFTRRNWNEIYDANNVQLYDEDAISELYRSFFNKYPDLSLSTDDQWDIINTLVKKRINSREVIDSIPLANQIFHEVIDNLIYHVKTGNKFRYSLLKNNCQNYAKAISHLLSTGKIPLDITDADFRKLAELLQDSAYKKFTLSDYFNFVGSEAFAFVAKMPRYMYESFVTFVNLVYDSGYKVKPLDMYIDYSCKGNVTLGFL